MALDLSQEIIQATTPSQVVNFDKNTPTTGGVVFTPDTPATTDVLYVSSTNASTWIYNGSAYVTYTAPAQTSTTPFYLMGTTIDAQGNKTAAIQHNGYIKTTVGFIGNGYNITSLNTGYLQGTIPTSNLGSGTADNTKYLRGDNTWQTIDLSGYTPTSRTLTINGTTYDLSANRSWTIASSIPNAINVYVDSVNGVDSTGRGDINTPYLTPEYALTQISNTGTVTGNTTNNSTSVTSISSTTNLKVGQYVSGTGIPYNTRIVGISGSTLTLSQNCTATNTGITITYYTPYTIVCSGNFTITSTLEKAGVFWDFGNSSVNWGALSLFTISSQKFMPFIMQGGYFYGKTSSSTFIYGSSGSAQCDFILKPKQVHTLTTGTALYFGGVNDCVRKFIWDCDYIRVPFGTIGYIQGQFYEDWYWRGYAYGLLGGLTIDFVNATSTFTCIGKIETPSSILALNLNRGGRVSMLGEIKGGFYGSGSITGNITGTNVSLFSNEYSGQTDVLGIITATTINCSGYGAININTVQGGTLNNTCYNLKVNAFSGAYSGTSASKVDFSGCVFTSSELLSSITLSGTSKAILNETRQAINGAVMSINIGSGCTLENKGLLLSYLPTVSGTLINTGTMKLYSSGGVSLITGTFINRGGTITLIRSGAESSTNIPALAISTGTLILEGGTLECTNADSKSGLIRKTASGGKLILKGQVFLKTANGLAPLQILSNTGTAQDVLDFSMIGNGAVGFRIADTFSDTTYGTTYAPNLLVAGDKKESTTYSW